MQSSSQERTSADFRRFLAWLDFDEPRACATHEELRRRLTRMLRRQWGDRAEEFASEALLRTAGKFRDGKYLDEREAPSYIGQVAVYICKEARRSMGKEPAEMTHDPVEPGPSQLDLVVHALDKDRLKHALSQLTPEHCDLIVEYYTSDRAELAKKYGLTPNALAVRASYIREKLRRMLESPAKKGGFPAR